MSVNRNNKYFIHNVYGAEQDLLDSLPSNVIAVPAGWDEAAETARAAIIADMEADCDEPGYSVSFASIPCVIYWRPAYTWTIVDPGTEESITTSIAGTWYALDLFDFSNPDTKYTWDIINTTISDSINKDINR